MSKQSLLLVDGDTRSLRVLEVSLRKAGFTVTTAVSVQDALDKLELHAPDLIISETTFPDGDGFELRRRVRATPDWGEIPFIFLTAENAIENKIRGLELGVDDYLTKPIYIKEIITRINILLQKRQRTRFEERRDGRTRFAGRVADMPVVDVIQTIEISRKSGVIQFVGDRGRQAAIYFRDGRVIDAEAGALQGADAVYRLLTWNEGEFEVMFRTVRRREVITMSSQGLLMEGMRRLDEWSRLLEQLPPLQHRFEVEVSELAIRLGDVPDEHNRILRLLDGKRTLLEVIDACDLGDLECLQAISRLYFEELLVDLDHATPVRRETGRAIQIVDVSAPTPFEDAASGPVRRPRTDVTAAVEAAEAALAAAAAAMSRAESAIDVEAAGEPELGDLAAVEPEVGEPEAVEPEAVEPEAVEPEAAELGLDEPGAEESLPGTLMGGYRPSSLRLIDEAVAAAQAIEPSLFEDEPGADGAHANGAGGNGVQPGADGAHAYADAERTTPPRPSGRRTTAPRFSVGSPAVGSAAVVTEAADSAAAASGAPSGELSAKPSGISARAGTAAPGVTGRTTTGELTARSGAAGGEVTARGAGAVGDVVSGEEPARSGGASSSVVVGAPGGEVTARGVGVASGAAVGAASSVVVGAPGGEVTARGVGVASGAAGGTASELAERAGGASSGAAAGASSSVVVGAPSGEVTVRGVGVASDATAGGASDAAAGAASGEVAGRGAAAAVGAASTREAGVAAPGAGASASVVLDAAAASGAVSASGRPSTGLVSGEIATRGGAAATGAAEPAGAATGAPTLPRAASVTLPGTGAAGTPSTASAAAGAASAAAGAAGLVASMASASADEAAAPALPRAITDPGLRMIGSLGRDRAEASGELVPAGSPPAPVSETQRELVTILPRRITREMQALPSVDLAIARAPTNPPIPAGDAAPASNTPPPASGRAATSPGATGRAATNPAVAEKDAAPVSGRAATSPGATGRAATSPGATGRAATSPGEAESAAVSVETPRERTSSRTPRPGSGVVRISRAPGLGTIVLLALAALLAVTAVYLRLRRTSPAIEPDAVASDAAVTDPSVSLTPDAALPPEEPDAGAAAGVTPDAAALPPEEPDAGAAAGVTPDAAAPVPAAGAAQDAGAAAPVEDKAAQAKALVEKANDAIQEGAFERALRAADASLALRKTARGYLARAKALQRLDRVDDALAAIDAAEKMAPKYASVYELRGRILWAVRRREEARQQFERFLELESEGPRAAQIQRLLAEPR